ncbi:hypothetical protein MUK42_07475 [Musa troglodytarum]|uniref:Uncharacterized protein n=1 Tax=Musa troglodytarum TaxID=320322 RepID=A0A9E7IAJ9_9LILI|nr:hypothetical protein MUK42_07475 [Musa troglodytarum]
MACDMKLRSSSSLPNLLLSTLNLLLLDLASASFAPVFLLRTSPTSSGWALFTVSSTTVLSSLLGFFSQLTRLCFVTHVSFILASPVGQALSFLALFLRPEPSLQLLGSDRSRKEQRVLMKVEEALLLGMFLVQSLVLVSACAVQRWWLRQYEEVEAERRRRQGRGTGGWLACRRRPSPTRRPWRGSWRRRRGGASKGGGRRTTSRDEEERLDVL